MELLPRLREALAVVHSPQSPTSERVGAQQFCDELCSRDDSAQLAVSVFCSCGKDELPLRHFALWCLDSFLGRRWMGVDQDTRDEIKGSILTMVLEHTRDILEEAFFVKEKLAVRRRGLEKGWRLMGVVLVSLSRPLVPDPPPLATASICSLFPTYSLRPLARSDLRTRFDSHTLRSFGGLRPHLMHLTPSLAAARPPDPDRGRG